MATRCCWPPDSVGGSLALRPAADGQRQGDVLHQRQVVQQAEVLEHHADAPAQQRLFPPAEVFDRAAEQADVAGRGPMRQVHQPQQRRFPGAGGAEQEMEGTGVELEVDAVQDFGSRRIA
jgi:hypothetical protein